MRRRFPTILLLCSLAWLGAARRAAASEYRGQVTFGGLPVPGATITAIQGEKKFTVTSDEAGRYRFEDLNDGQWTIDISLQCFVPLRAEVAITPQTPPGQWELRLRPVPELMALAKPQTPEIAPSANIPPRAELPAPAANGPQRENPASVNEADEQSSDGFLVNGSVNNAATSIFSMDRAFGNRRGNSRSLYNGGLAFAFDNSALDAKQYSLTGVDTPKPVYNRMTGGLTFGGPIRIPHLLLRNGPNLLLAYQWTRNHTAQTDSALVPTEAERAGNLLDAPGQRGTIIDPATRQPFPGNVVPVSAQAQALLELYPLPNVTGNPLYNYQVPVLNSTHQDALQMRMDKGLGRRYQLYGNFNFAGTRADDVSLFKFSDATDTLGLNTNINWSHRFSQRLFVYSAYHFSRLRTLVRPQFENRQNISGAAGIGGNDQSPANWGPPALNFTRGIAPLTDAQSAFNRNRTDGYSASVGLYHGRHNVTIGGDVRRQQYNDFFQQDPRGTFTFTGATTGSDLADFLIGIPDASSMAFGNADKYFRQTVYDAYAADDWRVSPILTINAGVRWEYGAPMTELHGRLVNLDVASGFQAVAPVLGSNPIGPLTGERFPASLVRPDRTGIEPRIGVSWRPMPASTIVIRAGYGIYHDTSVYLNPLLELAQQAPLSKSVREQNSASCALTLANGFTSCAETTSETFGIDPGFRVGYAQDWNLTLQRDLPGALQLTATYLGVKGTHGPQEFLPNSYPLGAPNPCPACPSGFVFETSGGNSTRQSGQMQLRRRLKSGFTALLLYTYSKSIDDDAVLGGQGHMSGAAESNLSENNSLTISSAPAQTAAIAQDWLDLRAERSLSSFDQRHLLNVQAQYTTGQGLEGGTLLHGWPGRLLKEWTLLTRIDAGSGFPETPYAACAGPRNRRGRRAASQSYGRAGLRIARTHPSECGGVCFARCGNMGNGAEKFHSRSQHVQSRWRPAAHVPAHGEVLSGCADRCEQPVEPRGLQQLGHDVRERAVWPTRGSQPDAQRADDPAPEVLTMRRLFGIAVLMLLAAARAQQVGQNRDANTPHDYTLSMRVQLVVETVVVKDKQGNPIQGLSAKDFVLTEDGAPQTIRFCEHQDLAGNAKPLPESKRSDEDLKIYRRLARSQITPDNAESERYRNRRLLVLYFDMAAMRPADQLRALYAAERFIRRQMTSVDLVSIMRYNSATVDVLQDFTSDRDRLLSILETMIVGEGQDSADEVDDASSSDTGAAFGQDDAEFNVFNTDRQLSALQTAAQMLGRVAEKKSLIYFAGGLRLNGINNQAQLHATVDAAIKAGVSFWPIDARGLTAEAPLGDATQASQGNANIYTGAAANATTINFQLSQDTLYALAGDTGGKAFLDANDLDRGIAQAQQAISDYYVIGYYTTNPARDGKFRRVKISLAQNVEARLDYRQGYYADKEFGKFTAVDKERQLEDALMLEDPITELSIAMEIDYFQLNRAEYFVPVVVKIPGRELALAKRGGAEHTLIDFVGEIKDVVGGTTVSNVRDHVNIKLSDATAAELAHRPIEYDTGFTLLPGRYTIKFLARDDETGRIGTFQTTFVIPNLNKEEKRIPISSVVLSSQRVELKQAIYDAAKAKERAKEDTVNPLVQDGSKLIPSVTRVFNSGRNVYVYLQAYRPPASGAAASTPPLLAFVSLYAGGKEMYKTTPIAVEPNAATRLGVTPLSFDFGIQHLAAGQYECQVTVLDPSTTKASFWRAPIVITR